QHRGPVSGWAVLPVRTSLEFQQPGRDSQPRDLSQPPGPAHRRDHLVFPEYRLSPRHDCAFNIIRRRTDRRRRPLIDRSQDRSVASSRREIHLMTDFSGRACSGARPLSRALLLGTVAILGLLLSACGNDTFVYGTPVITFSATPGGPFS